MKCVLVGSRYFGATVLDALRRDGVADITRVVAPAGDDRLALAARAAGIDLHLLADPKIVPGEAIPEGTDLILAAHTHARVSNEALARSRLGGVGYHPSLLPRHRGIAAVEWTILEGDAVAGGSVYHLANGWDAGAIAAQDWCFVANGETARELWERALAPIGLALLARVVRHAQRHGDLPAQTQDARFATRAPKIRRAVVMAGETPAQTTALVVTVNGPDRPGIVSQIAERALRFGANWAASRLERLAGEFAGMVHLEVPHANAGALADALRALESNGLRLVVASSGAAPMPAGQRGFDLELAGAARLGIVSQLTRSLAGQGITIERIQTEIMRAEASAKPTFKVVAHVLAPASLSAEDMRGKLEGLAREMMLDIALDERGAAVRAPAG